MSKSNVQSVGGKYPITALETCDFAGDRQHLLWGAGSELCIKGFDGDFISRFSISSNDSVHGIRSYGNIGLVAAYGGKALLLVVREGGQFNAIASCQQLDDMILDFFIEPSGSSCAFTADQWALECFVGYAHNFIDIAEIKKGTNQYTCKRRIQCPDMSALFNMTIYPGSPSDNITIASGTVFGKIILWSVANDATAGAVHSVAIDHEGVIFRIKWSTNGDRMISVSDDRTVRMWQVSKSRIGTHDLATGLQLVFTGWGHISRVWDAVFLNDCATNISEAPDCEIASCSEDGTVKLWNNQGQCTATLCGHSNDVWRLATAHAGSVIISGGNDSSIKMWDVAYQRKVAPEDSNSALVSVLIPTWAEELPCADALRAAAPADAVPPATLEATSEHSTASPDPASNSVTEAVDGVLDGMDLAELAKPKKKKAGTSSRRANGVCSVRISPCLRWLVVVLVEGGIWLVQLNAQEAQAPARQPKWIAVTHLETVISTMDAHFDYEASGSPSSELVAVKLLVSYLNGENLCVTVKVDSSIDINTDVSAVVESKAAWRAHEFRTVNIWFAADASVAITATIKGACSLWKLGTDASPASLVHTCTTPGREIVTACALIARDRFTYLVVGDARGSVSVFTLPAADVSSDAPLTPTACFMKVHGTDPVSCVEPHAQGFVTAGHDGMLHIYHEACGADGVYRWLHTSKRNCLPISTPDQIIISENVESDGTGDGLGLGLYVCGYHGSAFMIWDLRRGYQVMRVEGGGWKRPHRCLLCTPSRAESVPLVKDLPSVLFVCPAPLLKDNTVLQLFGAAPKLYPPQSSLQVSSVASLPLHVGSAGHGRVAYCATFITSITSQQPHSAQLRSAHIVVGGEESCVKVYSVPDLTLQQEVSLSLNSSMKALASARSGASADRGIVVGGGGKLLYYIWLYDRTSAANMTAPLGSVLYSGLEGSIWTKATQDHRILSVQCTYLDCGASGPVKNHPEGVYVERYLVLLCDSRGSATIGMFEHAPLSAAPATGVSAAAATLHAQFTVIQQLQPSQCPLLSSALLLAPGGALAVFGDTAGVISVWHVRQNQEQGDNVQYR